MAKRRTRKPRARKCRALQELMPKRVKLRAGEEVYTLGQWAGDLMGILGWLTTTANPGSKQHVESMARLFEGSALMENMVSRLPDHITCMPFVFRDGGLYRVRKDVAKAAREALKATKQ